MSTPVWFITAASSGFDKQIAVEALNSEHLVAATACSAKKLEHMKAKGAITMEVDVIQPLNELQSIVKTGHDTYSRIDYLANPAGYILKGAVEEAT